ncbi:MAG: LuxR C-terminal-related transcriptional regulator [Coriobacteriales bacterium]|jgi:DNA-binding CsgD family transcriptional regulator|nr:LuxR C-terminal-related transcriptional regulator [Coriobacteriales bacterium]
MKQAPNSSFSIESKRSFLANALPLFSLSFLGLVAIRIWIQCTIYDRYLSTDSGILTIAINFIRIATIALFLFMCLKDKFSPNLQKQLSLISTVLMTLASILFLLLTEFSSPLLLALACLCAGVGITWGGGIWICFYARLAPKEALFYAFASLALSSIAGLLLGFFSETVSYSISILMPALSLAAFRSASKHLDERSQVAAATPSAVYDQEPKSTLLRLLVGLFLLEFALGVARGFPFGLSLVLPVPFQVAHQFSVVLLCAGIIWWVLVKGNTLKFSPLWNMQLVLLIIGVLFLISQSEELMPFGATLITISNTFILGLIWYCCYDYARHTSLAPYVVLGVAWAIHIFPRELGRSLIWIAQPHSSLTIIVIAFMICLLALSIIFLFSDRIPVKRPFFAGLKTAPPDTEKKEANTLVFDLDARVNCLQARYILTKRETEVLRLFAQGRSKAFIAQELFITENTVRTYTKSIYTKCEIHNKQELLTLLLEA